MPRFPEFFFRIINPAMAGLLRSPLHPVLSGSVVLLTFVGRNSGRRFTTPVRYIRSQNTVRCFTAQSNQWWRNMRNEARVELRIAGMDAVGKANAVRGEPEKLREHLQTLLTEYPGDAPYYDLSLQKDGTPIPAELEQALARTVMVEIEIDDLPNRN